MKKAFLHFFNIWDEENKIDLEDIENNNDFEDYLIDYWADNFYCSHCFIKEEDYEEPFDSVPDNADCYAIQDWTDGFGNDTYTITLLPTKEQAINYALAHDYKTKNIVPQYWGSEYVNAFD